MTGAHNVTAKVQVMPLPVRYHAAARLCNPSDRSPPSSPYCISLYGLIIWTQCVLYSFSITTISFTLSQLYLFLLISKVVLQFLYHHVTQQFCLGHLLGAPLSRAKTFSTVIYLYLLCSLYQLLFISPIYLVYYNQFLSCLYIYPFSCIL